MATILCVDDEPAVGVMVEHALKQMGHRCLLAESVDESMKLLERSPVDLIVADYQMPEKTGLDLLTLLEQEGLRIPVIIMTGYSSIEHAVVSIRSGASDYLTKPVRAESLKIAVSQALEVLRLRRENETFRRELLHLRTSRVLIGESPIWRRALETLDSVAPTKATVLLEGESGTGKELLARAIHERSPRHSAPFVTVNCAALPEGLVESALFGHERGAFTGATARTTGAFERAHGGTLLLDEISEMRLDLQSKLLRAIQEQEFERVGGSQSVRVDVRLLATTNLDLKSEMAAGRFRSDLYYRLNVVPIRTPALRERPDDIPRLAHHFVQRAAASLGLQPPELAPETLRLLQSYAWPGNVRELANAVERALILSREPILMPGAFAGHLEPLEPRTDNGALPQAMPAPGPESELPLDLNELERRAIARALAATGGNRTRAAKLLGISERTLRNRLKAERELEG
ncbi:MAG: sigma-54-dependent Fis family transcriptional regulator [Gemmatimonadales bacterium]|nr:sigma-54-dependent Fis family transcriptional regulator [Gemmatimonadales bacterium]